MKYDDNISPDTVTVHNIKMVRENTWLWNNSAWWCHYNIIIYHANDERIIEIHT